MKHFIKHQDFDTAQIQFALGADRNGKVTINMTYQPMGGEVAMVSAAAITQWPRCSGDGNFGTMWGPQDITKAKFTLDLSDGAINEQPNTEFLSFMQKLEQIDDKLLDFVTENQLKILGRKNLSRDELKMLQIRTIRAKYDKMTGVLNGHSINLSTAKFCWDGMGGKYARAVVVCDHTGKTVPNGQVAPGDVVAATIYANSVYTGVGGDKFGISWSFEDVQVVCQRSRLARPTEIPAFREQVYDFAADYCTPCAPNPTEQFSEPMSVA